MNDYVRAAPPAGLPRPRSLPEVPEKDPSPRNPNRLTASTWEEAHVREPAKSQDWATAPRAVHEGVDVTAGGWD